MIRKSLLWWLVVINLILWSVAAGILAGDASAENIGPIQTINTNEGIPCTASGSQGSVARCRPQWTYGCSASPTGQQILAADGGRTSILFQDTGTVPIVLCFGDSCVGNNGFVVQAGKEFLWSNIGNGNIPGRLLTSSISVIASGATSCAFLFTN